MKNSGYSFINLAGLTVGLACTILILLWVLDETSFDSFHKDKDRIFQVMAHHAMDESTFTDPATPGPLADALREIPEVEASFHTRFTGRLLFQVKDLATYEEGLYATAEIFNVFNFPIVAGDIRNGFRDDNSIAISQTMASKYFGDENALGKTFRISNRSEAKVSAVFKDIPDNSSIRFQFVMPYSVYAKEDKYNSEWGAWTGGPTYVKLREQAMKSTVNDKIASLFTKPKIWVRWDDNVVLFLFPLSNWRLYNNFENGMQTGGRINYVRTFSLVGVFILLIACINFMNLATAGSLRRSREVAVRKVVGAGRRSLITQFIGESIFVSLVALSLALIAVHLVLPAFSDLTGKRLGMDYTNPIISGSLIGICVLTGTISGSYPAFILASVKVLNVMKGIFLGFGDDGVRKALVVFQFSLSVILIISAMVVDDQIRYMRNKNLGFDRENVFYFSSTDPLRKNFEPFRYEALQHPGVEFVAQSNSDPVNVFSEIALGDDAWPGKTKDDDVAFKWIQCDYDFLPALGFTLIDGRNFSRNFSADSGNYIITEEAARRMKFADPVGQIIKAPWKGQIIGIVKDFHSSTLQGPVAPAIIALRPEKTDRIFVRYKAGYVEEAIASTRALSAKFDPGFPPEFRFLDETFNRLYQQELLIGKLATYFTGLAIFISCLGLFGLASFTAIKRTKEIGVRKVFGATVWQVVVLLCHEYVLLMGVSLLIGIPLGWWAMHKFLDNYVFHTEIGISIFVMTALSMMLMALLTVSFQSARAALANPVRILRTE